MTTQTQPTNSFEKRWQQITSLWQDERATYELLGGTALVLIGLWFGVNVFGGSPDNDLGYWTNVFTEMLGVLVTIFVVNWFAARRDLNNRKKDLMAQIHSRSEVIAVGAVEELMRNGWFHLVQNKKNKNSLQNVQWESADLRHINLSDAAMQKANLNKANLYKIILTGANLHKAQLKSAILYEAKLQSTNLSHSVMQTTKLKLAQLQNANISSANLHDADLAGANLQSANLSNCNLQSADFGAANLKGAILRNANLKKAKFNDCQFDEKTVLPNDIRISDDDGNMILEVRYWTPDTDMTRYTNPEHPDFWQPMWAKMDFASYSEWASAGRPTE